MSSIGKQFCASKSDDEIASLLGNCCKERLPEGPKFSELIVIFFVDSLGSATATNQVTCIQSRGDDVS